MESSGASGESRGNATPYKMRNHNSKPYSTGKLANRLFVKNLPEDITRQELSQFFTRMSEACGNPVRHVEICEFREKSAIVQFNSENEAKVAASFNGTRLKGSELVIEAVRDVPQEPGNIVSLLDLPAPPPWNRFQGPDPNTLQPRTLWVRHVPFGVHEIELLDFFNNRMHFHGMAFNPGGPAIRCRPVFDAGYYMIEMRSIGEAAQMLKMDGINFRGSRLMITRPDAGPVRGPGMRFPGPEEGLVGDSRPDEGPMFDGGKPGPERELYVRPVRFLYKTVPQVQAEVVELFNRKIKSAGLQLAEGDPVVNFQIIPGTVHGFLQFRSVEETTKALALDGISFQQNALSVKRPKEYKNLPGHEDDPDVVRRYGRIVSVKCSSIKDKDAVGELITQHMLRRGLTASPGNPVLDCQVKSGGKYITVLFRSAEEATAVHSLDNVDLDGHVINIQRPENIEKSNPKKARMKPECKLFVSNIPTRVTKKELMHFFNELMHQTGLGEGCGPPVTSCFIVPSSNFAHLEFRSPTEAAQALILDNISFKGRNLKITRPPAVQASDGSPSATETQDSPRVVDNTRTQKLETENFGT